MTPQMAPAVRAFQDLRNEIERDGDTAHWRVLIGVTFVQTHLLAADSPERDQLIAALDQRHLAAFRAAGELLRDEVIAARDETPGEVVLRMERCLRQHLNLAPATATVERIF